MGDNIVGRWSESHVQQWYEDRPWPCGFNYVPANAISYTEMWLPEVFSPQTIAKELALAEQVGFNMLRVVLPFVVWEHDPEAFSDRLSTFLALCDDHGIGVMPALFDDCAFGSDDRLKDPWFGPQVELLEGWYANGWTPSPGHSMVRDRTTWPRLEAYVKNLLQTFGSDGRIAVWDLYNEPTNGGLGDVSIDLVVNVLRWAREVSPVQPLTIGVWNDNNRLNDLILSNSDVLTFHNYRPAAELEAQIHQLREHVPGRPLINTEWLNRGTGSTVPECLQVFRAQNVGCLHWGLVNGRTQTHLHWGWRPGQGTPEVWQHDIFHPDHRTYDPAEIRAFRAAVHRT